MDSSDITLNKFQEKATYSSDTDPGNKMVMSNGAFAQCLVMLKLINSVDRLVNK